MYVHGVSKPSCSEMQRLESLLAHVSHQLTMIRNKRLVKSSPRVYWPNKLFNFKDIPSSGTLICGYLFTNKFVSTRNNIRFGRNKSSD
ncbi:hypothetical protein TNCT_232951 [Trichonephila clavata]|uniref:Uncharacterized protein n=1 Tax=Trichonephila clavata TaxID=2740835 RepID=A0A8X6JDQ9_TRICU|nr:hypothetical protein TNCT_232951 [Trichonephila clavata]